MGPHRLGRVRSEIETNLHKEWGSASLNEEQIDKCKFLEKRAEMKEGFIRNTVLIDKVT